MRNYKKNHQNKRTTSKMTTNHNKTRRSPKIGRVTPPCNNIACISTNQSTNSELDKGKSSGSRAFDQLLRNSRPLPSTKKKRPIPDKSVRESITKHRETCKSYCKTVERSYVKRKFQGSQKVYFDTLLGCKHKYSDHLPASDLMARNKFGRCIIKSTQKIWKQSQHCSNIRLYHITFISDKFLISERNGMADVFALKQKIQHILRHHTKLNALGVIELQAITNYPKGNNGGSLSLHAHVLAWGPTNLKKSELSKRAKGFKAKLTRVPVLSQSIPTLCDLTTVARYISKPPYKGKYVDYGRLRSGKPCLNQITDTLIPHHHLRIFEYMAKTPLELTLFGVRDGVLVRKKIVKKLGAVDVWDSQMV